MTPAGVGLFGIALSGLAYLGADRADERRVLIELESRSEWRARDIEAKIRLSGNAVENVAIAMAASPDTGPQEFARLASRARRGLVHVNSLQWAPRVRRADIPAFEQAARDRGLTDYKVYEVDREFQRVDVTNRQDHFPVLYDARFRGDRRVPGLSLGRFEGRAAPMREARDTGGPVATMPVRPIGRPTPVLVYLLFWPVFDGIDIPGTLERRRERLRGYVLGNYNVADLLAASLRAAPATIETIHFSIAPAHREASAEDGVTASYRPDTGKIDLAFGAAAPLPPRHVRMAHHFEVFGQHWDLTFDYGPAAVAALRSSAAWGWLAAGLIVTASLVFYLLRERGRRETIAALVAERTAQLEQTHAQLQQAQKMEAIGTLTGGLAHDFNNLLAVVIGNLELLIEKLRDRPGTAAYAEAALQAGLRGADLTRQLLAFARRQPLEPSLTDVNELVVGMARLLRRILEENIEVRLITPPDLWPAMVDPAQLNSAIANLATNARDAMPDGGRLTIETRNVHLPAGHPDLAPDQAPGDYVLLDVSDTGSGMAPETLALVFEPFFTTKEVGRGSGLGLSMVFGFVKQSHGQIRIDSAPGRGTTVRIHLPRAEQEPIESEQSEVPPPLPQRGQAAILVVEDNAAVRRSVTMQLGSLGYAVIEARNAQHALTMIRDGATPVDLLFTDMVMPGDMNGFELADAALAVRPGLKVLFTSGYSADASTQPAELGDGRHFIGKPYRKRDLARKLAEVLGS